MPYRGLNIFSNIMEQGSCNLTHEINVGLKYCQVNVTHCQVSAYKTDACIYALPQDSPESLVIVATLGSRFWPMKRLFYIQFFCE